MLPEWEQTLNLSAGSLTVPERQLAVVAALIGTGNQSPAFFIQLAASLGYTIAITQYRPWRVNDPVNMPIYGVDWAYTWLVTGPAADAITYTATADIVQATPNFGIPALENAFGAAKGGHTICICKYV